MVNRYFEIKPHLGHFEDITELADFMLSARENLDMQKLQENLVKLESVTKALQRNSTSLADVRVLFDAVIQMHPSIPYLQRFLILLIRC